ncbi:hypothetical protein M407DRAFT_8967 [Tulasnella calospora MUT 4182]|uniref:Uncharacterized protein n=1 Tax=Tulasnella calospora MUT 4182 TaxID=1051891 RepID=A0A0C3QG59_9AGAM|nr:hypothetical protein M407DRAFT_8967 [Tulasnella calospora MUT 4182]
MMTLALILWIPSTLLSFLANANAAGGIVGVVPVAGGFLSEIFPWKKSSFLDGRTSRIRQKLGSWFLERDFSLDLWNAVFLDSPASYFIFSFTSGLVLVAYSYATAFLLSRWLETMETLFICTRNTATLGDCARPGYWGWIHAVSLASSLSPGIAETARISRFWRLVEWGWETGGLEDPIKPVSIVIHVLNTSTLTYASSTTNTELARYVEMM